MHFPYNVADFIKSLPNLDGKSFFTFLLHATYKFDTVEQIKKAMRAKNGNFIADFSCFGEGNFLEFLKRGTQFSPDHPTKVELEEAVDFGKGIIDQYNNSLTNVTEVQAKPP